MDAVESIDERHKRERKELQGKIQSLKHGIPKSDKKRKKQVTVEIAQLEAELDERHAKELKENTENVVEEDINEQLNSVNLNHKACDTEENIKEASETNKDNTQPKISKAQKRREKKEAEDRARQKRLEEGEKEAVFHSRNVEANLFNSLLNEKGLRIAEVNPDGNCLYNSVLLQITKSDSSEHSLSILRAKTCDYMVQHTNDFLPFTSNAQTGDMFTIDEYTAYCNDIKETNSWGGQLELRAISQIYEKPIEIYQASSSTLRIGEEFNKPPIRLSYHRHQYGLGEHYNALLPDT